MAETPLAAGTAAGGGGAPPVGTVDYSNAYHQDGSPNPAHRLWCCVLSLMAVLLAALPGHAAGDCGAVLASKSCNAASPPLLACRCPCCRCCPHAASMPRVCAVEEGALRLAVDAEPRLLLAAEPPAASVQQPLTLAMAQETKYTFFFLCSLARLSGQVG